jgi:hypothetical protein
MLQYISKGQSLSQAIVNTSLSNKLSKQMAVIFEIENQNIRIERLIFDLIVITAARKFE